MRATFLFSILFLLLLGSCSKNKDGIGELTVQMYHHVDGSILNFNAMNYNNDAGYPYSVTRLEYYLSNFEFTDLSGHTYKSSKVFYINADKDETCNFSFSDIPSGHYSKIQFLVGLDTAHNKTDFLDPTVENANMAWPDMMGGGYHFIKFEGLFNANNANNGFALHLGTNGLAVPINIEKPFTIFKDKSSTLLLNMNLNEWFRSPEIYDFLQDGSYSMDNMNAMMKLSRNGKDLFN
ncbi:MAG TPA: hypothetical protein PKA54_04780 [Chitinophagaceae bacterium]|nr:MAG: hypothetical protein UZ11_BCD004001173 [Bacteroidetes bacterium OLB11]HMN32666.1 hypothetical protein [Chitinophagaceae bacterium]